MFSNYALQKLLVEDVRREFNWSDTDSEGYDGDNEEFIEKFNQVLHVPLCSAKNSRKIQQTEDDNVSPHNINIKSEKSHVLQDVDESLPTKANKSIVDIFSLFFDEKILIIVADSTNTHISAASKKFSRKPDCQHTTIDEIKVFIGLLILAGLLKFNSKLDDLWEKKWNWHRSFPADYEFAKI